MHKITALLIIPLTILCFRAKSQNNFSTYKIYYKDFLINSKSDTILSQLNIKKGIDDGEYFIYSDKGLKKIWLHGIIYNNKLDGKWEFLDEQNEIYKYKMFVSGKQIDIGSTENTFIKIYLPNKVFQFRAFYISAMNDTLTDNLVEFKITSHIFEIIHNPRFEGVWTFNYNRDDSLLLAGIYPTNVWVDSTGCLITENESQIQIYPPRCNQFAFTEIIYFPSISPLYLKQGYKWESQTQIHTYTVKEWENTFFYHKSEIIGKRNFLLLGKHLECWIIKGESFNQDFGISYFEYLFNEEYGFVRMEWINYDKQKAIFELFNLKKNL